jgi:hypothetical protein
MQHLLIQIYQNYNFKMQPRAKSMCNFPDPKDNYFTSEV